MKSVLTFFVDHKIDLQQVNSVLSKRFPTTYLISRKSRHIYSKTNTVQLSGNPKKNTEK